MKRTMNLMAICMPLLMATHGNLQAASQPMPGMSYSVQVADWMKSTTGTWPGMKDGKTYWYKLDKKGGLWWSTDGKKWAAVKEGAWADKDGKWLKIHDKKLVWSTDGKTWAEVPEWKWQGADNKWYKFDSDWALWVNG
ncbi:hypothetical protein HB364_27450 [Pseudoflavitalea sp. X16]|uniref:hypothetical protein n=1 Tax=Paraflavitalea devenefica TaxID=2716334 RepID=UPI00141F67B9|nr:hypothetical protein [Paraflavitalea devenefica]NII28845.1 hypothetical protein [Paraflavitalea devenefica]